MATTYRGRAYHFTPKTCMGLAIKGLVEATMHPQFRAKRAWKITPAGIEAYEKIVKPGREPRYFGP